MKLESGNLNIHAHKASVCIAVETKAINKEKERKRDTFIAISTIKVVVEVVPAIGLEFEFSSYRGSPSQWLHPHLLVDHISDNKGSCGDKLRCLKGAIVHKNIFVPI